jgi:F-type H+-transporting ATPase subunit b
VLESLNSFKFILAALNLVILFVILRKVLFKPITEFMENRTKAIADSIESAEAQKTEAAQLKRQYEEQLKSAKTQGEKILENAVSAAEQERERIVTGAKQEAESLLTAAREEIEREHEQMLKDIRSQVAGIALAAASKVLEANMDTESNRQLVEKFIDEAGAA